MLHGAPPQSAAPYDAPNSPPSPPMSVIPDCSPNVGHPLPAAQSIKKAA